MGFYKRKDEELQTVREQVKTRGGCQARQFSDQMSCCQCGLVWGVNDPDPPPCLSNEELRELNSRRVAAKYLSQINAILGRGSQ